MLIPDIVVAPRGDFTEHDVQATSALIVEVRTAQTAYMDARTKRDLYAASGVPFYWQVDPVEPSITALKLVDHRYAGRRARSGHGAPRRQGTVPRARRAEGPAELTAQVRG